MSADPTALTLPTGEVIDVPPAFWAAFDLAVDRSCGIEDPAEARAAFGRELLVHLFALDTLLVTRAQSRSTQAVSVDTYTLALSAKHSAERLVRLAAALVEPGPGVGDLHAEFHGVVEALTGHAPPAGAARMAGVDLRLRALRELLLGIDIYQPAGPVPAMPADAAGDAPAVEGHPV